MEDKCVYIPSIGADLFRQLKKQFGYDKAVDYFYIAINPDFLKDYKKTLSLDGEGVPTYESLMKNPYIRKQIKDTDIIESLQKPFREVEDTQENYQGELEAAYGFNRTSPFNDKFIAVVEKQSNGNIQVVIKKRNAQSETLFKNQYSSNLLNKRMVSIFSPIGLTIGSLTKIETESGRVGVTDFNIAKSLASDFSSIIRVANNMEGAQAVGEEFSHLIIGCFIDDPLIQRAIKLLSQQHELLRAILGDDYQDTVQFHNNNMELVAEEALGHILQDHLISNVDNSTPTLVKRALNKLTNQFKEYDLKQLEDAIIEAESAVSSLAKGILDGTKTISKEDIINKQRDVQLNALSQTVDRNINILKEALKTEQKRFKVGEGDVKENAELSIDDIKKYLIPGADVAFGILNYAQSALEQLRYLQLSYNASSTFGTNDKFNLLKKTKLYLDSYAPFISALNDALSEDSEIENQIALENINRKAQNEPLIEEFSDLLANMEIDGQTLNLSAIAKELNNLNQNLTNTFFRHAKPAFLEFIKPFLGNNILIKTGNMKGKVITIEELLNEANQDISFFDRWLDSMADSSDILLQLFDKAVKEAKNKARLNTIDIIQHLSKLRIDAENMGITSFDWMFEKDDEGNKTGNYISQINQGQYLKDKANFKKYINEKYGVNPKGDLAKQAISEIQEWYKIHSVSLWDTSTPNPNYYKNKSFDSLNDNQKEILKKFLEIKSFLDRKLPENKVNLHKAVQIRKGTTQRLLDTSGNIEKLYNTIKDNVANSLLDRKDDDQLFGTSEVALKGFDGKEFMTLPVLYTIRLEDPNELSTDVFGSMMSYAYMANTYEQMDAIVDQLEIGRTIVTDESQRHVRQTRGNNFVIEKFKAKSDTVVSNIFTSNSHIVDKLNDFFESQVYGRYLKDEGTFEVFGKEFNTQKVVSQVLKYSSTIQLGFNFLANVANITTGVAMQNIEAACSQYFSAGELLKADREYLAAMKNTLSEVAARNKKSKLALFDTLFNIKQDFDTKVRGNQKKNWFERIFGKTWAFIGQEAGDHWLYNRTAIAMALRKKVLLNGKEMNLWEALKVQNRFEDNDNIKELNYREITELDGSPLNINDFSAKVAHINHGLFGIYNTEDAMAANRVCIGRILMQYRKWIKPQLNKRFQAGQHNVVMEEWEEGYYRTTLRLANDLIRGRMQLASCWNQMEDFERRNVIRTFVELAQFLIVWGLANWVEWPDDKERPRYLKLLEYVTKRLAHELGGLTPSTVMIQENLKTVKDPAAIISISVGVFNLFNSLISPEDWTDELQSGPYEGLSTLEKNIIKAPLPFISIYQQINKFTGRIDDSINYYARPAY